MNFTLMFEPAQTALALQARPYFINSFIRHRLMQSQEIKNYLDIYSLTGQKKYLEDLRSYGCQRLFRGRRRGVDLLTVKEKAEILIDQRNINNPEGSDGLMESARTCGFSGRPIWRIRV